MTVALLLGLALGCSRHPAPPAAPPPYETLLLLLSDFRRASQTDLYRNDTPLDVTGQNLFRATLARLDYFESNNPGIDVDIVNFTRAQARARLGDYAGAVKAYNLVAAFDESPLAPKAKERIEILRLLKEASDPVEKIDRLDRYFATLETKQKQLKALEKRFEGSHDAILARRELERVDTEYALALFRNRFVLENGSARALEFAAGMIERHSSSRRVQTHCLNLGLFYFELARDLAALAPPDRLRFNAEIFQNLVDEARKQFLIVSRADGYEEKPEAKAQIEALEAFARRIRKLHP